jgi:hypothetical protein
MSKIVASIIVASTLLALTGAPVQARGPTAAPAQPPLPLPPAASQTTQAPYISANPDRSAAESVPLFHIAQVPVVVWAPVQAPYNSKANGTQAANAVWDVGAY